MSKSSIKKYRYRKEDADLFKDVVFLVEATHNEQFTFWQDYYDNPKYEHCAIEDWDEVSAGRIVTIGELDSRPVCVTIFWAYLEGYKVMFYEPTSQVVDHKMIDDWIDHFGKDITCDNGTRRAHTDSGNFHHCIHAIQQLVKKHGKGPGNPNGHRVKYKRTKDMVRLDLESRNLLSSIMRKDISYSSKADMAIEICEKIYKALK